MSKVQNKNIPTISVYCPYNTPRLEYTLDFIFRCVLSVNFIVYTDKNKFNTQNGFRFNYSDNSFSDVTFQIIPQGLLFDNMIHNFNTKIVYHDQKPFIQFDDNSDHLDPLSTIFYCISRYEEYLPFPKDLHGRYPATSSLLFSEKILEYPIVDVWINWIRLQLNDSQIDLTIPKPTFQYLPSYDIDHVRAYLWKGWKRNLGSTIKDILFFRFSTIKERIAVLKGKKKDPFDIFDYWNHLHQKYLLEPIYFWLLGDYNRYDKNPHFSIPAFRSQISTVSQKYKVGIHPSYASYLNPLQIQEEKKRLEKITQKSIQINRFHFLKFNLPHSYRMLIDLGFKKDYSMAYPDAIGFRAGTSHPFFWYDLNKEEKTDLQIHPFQVMDVTLKNYMKIQPEEAKVRIERMIHLIQENGGIFTTLWHNSSFHKSEWEGWSNLYEEIILCQKKEDYAS